MKKLSSWLSKGIFCLWSVMCCLIMILLLVFQQTTAYNRKNTFLFSNPVLLSVGLVSLVLLSWCYYKKKARIDAFFDKLPLKTICGLSIALFLVQAYVFYNMYFLSGWDVKEVSSAALSIASDGEMGEISNLYFSYYPNNFLLTWILSKLYVLNLHMGNAVEYTYCAILFQSALSCWTGYLLFRVVGDLTKKTYAYLAWAVFAVHVALSPWISIPYTDAMSLCIPLLILRMYQLTRNGKHLVIKWAGIGFAAFFGFKLKPQCVIVFIAVVISEALDWMENTGKGQAGKKLRNGIAAVCAGVLALLLCSQVIVPSMHIETDAEQEISLPHFAMMGLNTEHNGAYLQGDVDYSLSFSTKEERTAGNIETIQQRLNEMGIEGLVRHLAKKTLINYGDGTYAWSREGNFYSVLLEDRNETVSPFLKSLYYTSGENYQYFETFQHYIWILLVFCTCGVFLYPLSKKKDGAAERVIILSIIGITLFETIFEARARYLFAYSPFYIIAAILGWIAISKTWIKVSSKFRKRKKA